MSPLVPLQGEQARQSTFPPGTRVYISADPQDSISPNNTILAPGEVAGVMLQMGKPGKLDLFYKVQVKGLDEEVRTELIKESRLRFRNGSPVTVDVKYEGGEHCVDGIVLGYCDIPPNDDRRMYCPNEEFWYSVQLLDNQNQNVIRIMHEVSNSQLVYRATATPAGRKNADTAFKPCVKEEIHSNEDPTRASTEMEKLHGAECSSADGGAESIATTSQTTSQSLNEMNNAATKVKIEFDVETTGAPHFDAPVHISCAQDVTLRQDQEHDNCPSKRKTSKGPCQPLVGTQEIDLASPSKRLKASKPIPRKMTEMKDRHCLHSQQVDRDPSGSNDIRTKDLIICDSSNTSSQQFEAIKEPTKEVVTIEENDRDQFLDAAVGIADHLAEKTAESEDVAQNEKNWESLANPGSIPKNTKKTAAPRRNPALENAHAPSKKSIAKEKDPPTKKRSSLKIKIPRKRKEWTIIPPAAHESHTKAHNGGAYYWCAKCRECKGLWTGHGTMDHIEEGKLVHKNTVDAVGLPLNVIADTSVAKSSTELRSAGGYSGSSNNCSHVGSETILLRKPSKKSPFYAIMEIPIAEGTIGAAIVGNSGCRRKELCKTTNCHYLISSNSSKGQVVIYGNTPDEVENGAYFLRDEILRFLKNDDRAHDITFLFDRTTIEFFGDYEAYCNETGKSPETRGIGNNAIASSTGIAHESYQHRAARPHETRHRGTMCQEQQHRKPRSPHSWHTDLRIILPTTFSKEVYGNIVIGNGGRNHKRLKTETKATNIWFHCDERGPHIDVKVKNNVNAENVAHHILNYIQQELNVSLLDAKIVYNDL